MALVQDLDTAMGSLQTNLGYEGFSAATQDMSREELKVVQRQVGDTSIVPSLT